MGCDFHLSFENLRDIEANKTKYTLNHKDYLLVEFADFSIPPNIDDTLHTLQLAGLQLIVTHPERNALIRQQPERLVAMDAPTLLRAVDRTIAAGTLRRETCRIAEKWLAEDRVHFFASDAHDLKGRPLLLREAYDVVAKRRGENVAKALFEENPLAVFEGRPLPYRPDPPLKNRAAQRSASASSFFRRDAMLRAAGKLSQQTRPILRGFLRSV